MSGPSVRLPIIPSTTPTRAEAMRSCLLRAGLSRARGLSHLVLGVPKAWLGTAYHEVLEKVHDADLRTETLESAVERLWNVAIASQHARASSHSLDQRFGPPERWPGYYVMRASVELRARDLLSRATSLAAGSRRPSGVVATREIELSAFDGKLIGRPDVVEDGDVVDYKSGALVEYDEVTQADVVKRAYVRQLRIYGYLVKQWSGNWPRRGILLPSVGEGVEVALVPTECEEEAREAVTTLDRYNDLVANGALPAELASPSPANCKWCSHKLVCPSFWQSATDRWMGDLDGEAVQGPLVHTAEVVQNGAALACSIDVETGSVAPGRIRVSPLNLSTHAHVAVLAAGTLLRVVGLRSRSDGGLTPTLRTVVLRVEDAPRIVTAPPAQAGNG